MNICHLIPSLLHGGAEAAAVSLSNELARRGHHVTLVNVSGESAPRFLQALHPAIRRETLQSPPYSLLGAVKFGLLARRRRWDILISHLTPTLLHGAAFRLTGRPAPWIYVEHNPHSTETPDAGRRSRRVLVRPFYGFCTRIVCVSSSARETYFERHFRREIDKVVVLPNGIDITALRDGLSRQAVAANREKFGIRSGQPVVGILGRLVPEKGHLHFVQALQRHWESLRDLDPALLIVGDGPLRVRLRSAIVGTPLEHRCVFTGNVEDITEAFSVIDVVAIPSHSEGLPVVLLEALSLGKRVVAMNVGAIPEVLEGGCGELVPREDYDGFAQRLARVLRLPPADVASLSVAARQRVEERFSEAVMTDRYEALARELVSESVSRDR